MTNERMTKPKGQIREKITIRLEMTATLSSFAKKRMTRMTKLE